eukprot:maker-scaffold_3-snap-gene-9.40-mRNA-1 protein AED:0.15 eAED:0.15 QI:101/1/1/1/1/1/2/32/320
MQNLKKLNPFIKNVFLPQRSMKTRVKNPGASTMPRRPGVIALKCGMIPHFDEFGVKSALTVLQLENNQVIDLKSYKKKPNPNSTESEEFYSVLIGSGLAKPHRLTPSVLSLCKKHNLPPKRHLAEFRICNKTFEELSQMNNLVGKKISADHFLPGQYVDIQGKSIGKGFQGGMKRHGFKGQAASHGVSLAHRAIGSTNAVDPGRVFKGKKMPGQMGAKTVTVQNLKVMKVDPEQGLVFVRGHVPGKRGSMVKMIDAKKKIHGFKGVLDQKLLDDFDNYKLSVRETLKIELPFPAQFEDPEFDHQPLSLPKQEKNPIALLH